MAYVDRFLSALVSSQGSALTLVADEVAHIELGGTRRPITNKPFTGQQLLALLREIAPADALSALDSGRAASFGYHSADGGFQASAEQDGNTLRINIARHDAGAPGAPGAVAREAAARPAPVAPGAAPPSAPSVAAIAPSSAPSAAASATGAAADAVSVRITAVHPEAELESMEVLLRKLVERGGSDLHLRIGEPPVIRHHGEMIRLDGEDILTNERVEAMLRCIMPDRNKAEFAECNDTDFAYEIPGIARFRANALRERKGIGAVFRTIPAIVVTAEQLGISAEVQRLCQLTKGLVLVTGPTGSGKSTTLCALVDLINRTRTDHVITIEDPIEFVHESKKCIITQRQVGMHTSSFRQALRAALREDPDIILVGELRDLETVSIAIETAETGHLVFGTLHTTTAASTIDRVIDQFPPDRQEQVRVMLSESLKGVISQTLCKKIGGGRVAAREILLTMPSIANLIREAKTYQIPSIMQTSKRLGMVTLNDALMELVDARQVEPKEAYFKAVDKPSIITALKTRGHDTSFLDPVDAAVAGKAEPQSKAAARPPLVGR